VILTSVVSVVQFYVERRFARGAVRTLPPTPLQRLRTGLGGLRPVGRALRGAAR
jgi:polar amino acid transport system permease protein